jgi:hypothetical protein
MRAILNFLRFAADEKNYKMFSAGARAGGETVQSLADDIHAVAKATVGADGGTGLALLKMAFPKTASTIECNIQKIEDLEEILFPDQLEDGASYSAEILETVFRGEPGSEELWLTCSIKMRPPVTFQIPASDEDESDEIKVTYHLTENGVVWKRVDDSNRPERLEIQKYV